MDIVTRGIYVDSSQNTQEIMDPEKHFWAELGKQAGEAFILASLILISSLAVFILAIATPVIFTISAISGLISRGSDNREWRSLSV